MEFKEYLKIFRKNIGVVIISFILVTACAYIFSLKEQTSYEGNGSFTIVPRPASETQSKFYEYDGYYALQSASLFGNTVTSWLNTPDIILEIYKQAGVETEGLTSKALLKSVKAEMLPDTFSIYFQMKNKDKDKAGALIKSTNSLIQAKTAEFNQKSTSKVNFELETSEPAIIEMAPKKWLTVLAGAFAGLVLGIFGTFVAEYFKKS